jgi:Protein of unknown function (DUF3800)
MRHIFVDESGDLGFGVGIDYFVLAFISPESGMQLNKKIKNFNAHLIKNGWNRNLEIKATNIWYSPKNQDLTPAYKYKHRPHVPLEYVFNSICQLDCYIEYVLVKLDTVSDGLKSAPSSILYNHFSWQLLKGPLCYFPSVELFVDRRNREYHNLLKYDGYLEVKAGLERAEKGKPVINLQICHYHSGSAKEFKAEQRAYVEFGIRGLEAADFVCWAIKRKFENGDSKWYSLIEKRIRWKQHLYFEPK